MSPFHFDEVLQISALHKFKQSQLPESSFPSEIKDPDGRTHTLEKSKQRRCKICHKIRRRSCSVCDVGLCTVNCFANFHTDYRNYRLYVVQYDQYGKNHRTRAGTKLRYSNFLYQHQNKDRQPSIESAAEPLPTTDQILLAPLPSLGIEFALNMPLQHESEDVKP